MKSTYMCLALFAVAASVCFAPSAQATVLIDSTNRNGGFVTTLSGYQTSVDGGWTASSAQGVWVDSGNGPLGTAPFGADIDANSHFIQIVNNGENFSSSAFTLTAGHGINFSVDWREFWSKGSDQGFSIDLVGPQTVNLLSKSSVGGTSWVQEDNNSETVPQTGSYQLVMSLGTTLDPDNHNIDYHVDRVHLESIVPEPSTFALAALGLLGLIGFGRRRKR